MSHPGPGVKDKPSFCKLRHTFLLCFSSFHNAKPAGMVFSLDKHAMKYAAYSCVQPPRRELIDNVGDMMNVRVMPL